MKKILILTAGFGDGHNAAARNVANALEFVSDDVKVEVLDLFERCYGAINTLAQKTYLRLVQIAPGMWNGIYSLLDRSALIGDNLGAFTKVKIALGDMLMETQPDCVVSTYPVYSHIIKELFRDHDERPFRFVTIITDSISINSSWFRAPSDLFCVPNEASAQILLKAGIPASKVSAAGFPVSHLFAEPPSRPLTVPTDGDPWNILYIINHGKKKAGKEIEDILEIPRVHLTVTVGRDAELKAKLIERTKKMGGRIRILGWTNQMPALLMSSHLVVGKAGGATVQEAIAARCPMIVNQIIPGQEEGNARLIEENQLGVIAHDRDQVVKHIEKAFAHRGRQWQAWREHLRDTSKPDASLRIAEMLLTECDDRDPSRKPIKLFEDSRAPFSRLPARRPDGGRMLLCDFHTHTNYSDGKLTVSELVDFYGKRGFDCICVTDHIADPRRLIGKFTQLINFTLSPSQIEEYFDVIERERKRAMRKYGMLVMTGLEFNKDGYTRKTSAHLLGVDLKEPINPALDLPETILRIHGQGGLAIASHPHMMKSEWGKNTLYLWENQEIFAPLIDAWEVANRNNLFNPVSLKRLPFIANSDFHKPKHIYSWKTLLGCEKDPEAIKDCIRRNEHIAMTLYRDGCAEARKRHDGEGNFGETHPLEAGEGGKLRALAG